MINLSLKCSVDAIKLEPFACKVIHAIDGAITNDYSLVKSNEENIFIYKSIRVHIPQGMELNVGEVLLIFPEQKVLQRFYRPNSHANTIMITERCDQACMMCSQPPKNKDYLYWELYKSALMLVDKDGVLGISGGEPTLEKVQLFGLLEFAKLNRPDIQFHVLTNAQHFDFDDIDLLNSLSEQVLWGVPLYAGREKLHDNIVGKIGAFDNLMRGFNVLLQSGSRVELRTVVLQENLAEVINLSKFVAKNFQWIEAWSLMQLEQIGFARIQWLQKFADTSIDFQCIKEAITVSVGCGINIQLFNFPICTVPHRFRKYCVNSISDWKQKFLAECENCSKNNECCGFFEWYQESTGYEKVKRIKS